MTDDVLVFSARRVVDKLVSKHNYTFKTANVVAWAKKCAQQHRLTSDDPEWWLAAALRDDECLAACWQMLKAMR